MRIVATTLMLLISGFLTGAIGAVLLAVQANAGQETALANFALVCVFVVSSIVFFIVQFFGNVRRASNWALAGMLALIGVAVIVLMGIDLVYEPEHGMFAHNWPMVAGMTVPGAAIIFAQWLTVRLRNAPVRERMIFGRGAEVEQ
ncbi:MAG: hypothetical protein WBF87_14225 [Mesorhizobium sp.]